MKGTRLLESVSLTARDVRSGHHLCNCARNLIRVTSSVGKTERSDYVSASRRILSISALREISVWRADVPEFLLILSIVLKSFSFM